MKSIVALITFIYCTGGMAQDSRYEQMKKTLNEKSLPLVNMIVDTAAVSSTVYAPGEIEITDFLRRTDPGEETVRFHCQYRIRGGTASSFAKKSFAVKLLDASGGDLDADIFGIRKENSWILDAMAIDRTRMRNRVCFDVWNELSHTPYDTEYENRNGTKGVFAEVFINGDYHGLYCITDKIDRKLLGLKKIKVGDEHDVTVRGLLYKGVSWNGYTDIWLRSYREEDTGKDTWNGWELQYPDDYPSADTWKPLMNLIDFCSDSTSNDVFTQEYQDYFYTENLVDYAVMTMALNVGDNAYKNTFLSVVDITRGHRYMVSPWDMDQSLGGHWNGNYNETLSSIHRYDQTAPFNRLAVQNIDGFGDLVRTRWAENMTTLFSCDSIARRLDDYARLFTSSGAWEREYEKWNGNPVPLKKHIADEMVYVKKWYSKNYLNLCAQLDTDIPTGNMGTASYQSSANRVFTLDGRRISRKDITRKGIYIVDGKKVVLRSSQKAALSSKMAVK